MISIALIAAGVVVAAGVLGIFWNKILKFLQKGLQKVQQLVQGELRGSDVAFQKSDTGVVDVMRYYSRVEDHWQVTTVRRDLPPNEIPSDILSRVPTQGELDVTEELKLNLET